MTGDARTGRREVGSPEWCARLLRSTLDDALPLIVDALAAGADLVEGAPRTGLREFVAGHERAEFLAEVVLQSKIDMERSIRAVADLVGGIITLFESGGAPVSAMVLARSAGEAILRFCHIHDPEVSPACTLLRMTAYELESIEDNLRTAEAFGVHGESDARKSRENIATMHGYLESNGFARLAGQRRAEFTVNLTFCGEIENVGFNTTDAYKRYLPVGYWDWALGSGATHTRGWFLPNVVGTYDEAPFMDSREVAITVTLQILELASAFAAALGGHAGTDVDEYQRKIHQRRIGVTVTDFATGQPVGHREYGQRRVSPTFPLGTDGSSFLERQ